MGCMSSKARTGDGDRQSVSDWQQDGISTGYASPPMNGSVDDRDLGSQSDFPAESSVACELGTNAEGRSEAAFSRSSAQSGGATSGADRDDASAADMWSTQNDEIAPHVASPDDSARHDSFVYTPTEVSRDENWGSRSNGTAGDGGGVSEP